MITKFKIFESVNFPYKVGDYLLIKLRNKGIILEDVLCKITKIDVAKSNIFVKILDDRIEKMLNRDDREIVITDDYIVCWSENKEELEMLKNQNKYNL